MWAVSALNSALSRRDSEMWIDVFAGEKSFSKVERASQRLSEHLFSELPPPHTHTPTHLTSSHHYRHHRLHLIKDFPPWLTPRLPALLKTRGGAVKQTRPVFAEDFVSRRQTGGMEPQTTEGDAKPDWEGCRDATKGKSCKALQFICIIYHNEPRLTGMCGEKCLVGTSSGLSSRHSSSEEDLQVKCLASIALFII